MKAIVTIIDDDDRIVEANKIIEPIDINKSQLMADSKVELVSTEYLFRFGYTKISDAKDNKK